MARVSKSTYLCFDLGGTKLLAALINQDGRVLAHKSVLVNQSKGFEGLLKDFVELACEWPAKSYKSVSVASAGPLHAERGVLLDPTNFFTNQKSWGVVPLVGRLRKIFKKPVWLENDAGAAVLAESWKGGHGRKAQNVLAITLGTGVGVGVVANGQLVRAGQGLHPEASHIPIDANDKNFPCSCGAYGCIEANLGGTHFARRLSQKKARELTGADCVQLAHQGDPDALKAFDEYGHRLALAIRTFSVLFAPQVVVLSGGFSHAAEFYLGATEAVLPKLMERYREGVDLLPKISISKLGDFAGVLGAAHVAIHR